MHSEALIVYACIYAWLIGITQPSLCIMTITTKMQTIKVSLQPYLFWLCLFDLYQSKIKSETNFKHFRWSVLQASRCLMDQINF